MLLIDDINRLLYLTKETIINSANSINSFSSEEKQLSLVKTSSREIKAKADIILEKKIIKDLSKTGYSILSEETGLIQGTSASQFRFIVDPLDGTYNFARGLGPCAISVAFWDDTKPIFGVVYDILNKNLFWGGEELGTYDSKGKLSVSNISDKRLASLCTGFPARMNFNNKKLINELWSTFITFSKIRMIGSASMSLVNVASGNADCYIEHEIMIWDVAAGLALVEGAGGKISYSNGSIKNAMNVIATNKKLQIELK